VADADAADQTTIYTGEIDITPPDGFDWKTISETRLTVASSATEVRTSLQSKPYTDISVFHDVDTHAAKVSIIIIIQCFDAVGWAAGRASGL